MARFRSGACFAVHAGVAPIPVSSGRTDRHRLCRGGNRQLNAAVHRIAVTQLRLAGPGQGYDRRRRAQGDRTADAVRALKRRTARAAYQQLKLAEERLRTAAPAAARQRSNLARSRRGAAAFTVSHVAILIGLLRSKESRAEAVIGFAVPGRPIRSLVADAYGAPVLHDQGPEPRGSGYTRSRQVGEGSGHGE